MLYQHGGEVVLAKLEGNLMTLGDTTPYFSPSWLSLLSI